MARLGWEGPLPKGARLKTSSLDDTPHVWDPWADKGSRPNVVGDCEGGVIPDQDCKHYKGGVADLAPLTWSLLS